ncbi:MAG: DUF2442 domain-containing protein [Candidatus Dormiibacter spiritus]|nr:MAG: DUF2442 domain-containing protein [Candidatus Dormibacteraeota bacterium]
MVLRITAVEPLPEYRLRLTFNDGMTREISLSDNLWGEMFEPLKDPGFFRQVGVDAESRTVVWPNGLGLDPEVLHGDFASAEVAQQRAGVTTE